jgi:Domain of unknown function (DUF222)
VDIRYGRELLAGRYGPGSRDQRLEEFAQGRWADAGRPSAWLASGWLALQAGDVSRPEVLAEATGDELLGIGRAWKSLETWSFTGKLAVVRELIRRFPLNEDETGPAAGGLPDEWDPRLCHEVAAALGISVVAAGKVVNLAWSLDARLPGIGQALENDRLDPGRAKMIVDETSVLETEGLFARAEAIILAGLPGCKTWSDLQRLVQRAVITVDPDGARRRRERAEREDARVRFWRESTGTCALRGTGLPTDQALAATAHIEARAREYKAAGIKRPMDILRVMAYLDLINGVTVPQRAAWAQAEDDARQAQAARQTGADGQAARDARLRGATGQARDRFREKARARIRHGSGSPGDPGHDGGAGGGRPGGSADGGSAGGDRPGGGRPGDGDGASAPGGVTGSTPGGVSGSTPAGSAPGGDRSGCGPDPGSSGALRDDWADDDWPAGGGDPGGGDGDPGGTGLGNGLLPEGSYVGNRPGDYPRPHREPARPPCPGCGGTGGVGGLPIRANLTLPAPAIPWLAQRVGPGWRGSDGGGGGPGSGRHDRPGSCPACENRGSERMPGRFFMPVRGNLTFPLLTLLGLAERPGEAHGLGALDPGLVRDLAAAGAGHPASEFCVTITDEQGHATGHGCGKPVRGKAAMAIPVDSDRATFTPSARAGPGGGLGPWMLTMPGAPAPFTVDIGPVPVGDCDHRHASAGYQPGDRLRHLVQVRDGACSFPACSRHARESDFEHAQPFDKGGLTCACNAHACSRACHRVKQSPGWAVTKPRPGWTRWITMTGRTYLQGPWRYPA